MKVQFWLEMMGYGASLLVATSLTMRSLVRLRMINLVGASVFVVYGLLIRAYPIVFLDGLIVGINLFYLQRMLREKDYYTMMPAGHDSAYLHQFLNFYREDMAGFVEGVPVQLSAGAEVYFVLRNLVPAGLLVYERRGAEAYVLLDYVIPMYRDFRVAQFLFVQKADFFRSQGIERFVSPAGRPHHERYLARMGFRRDGALYAHNLGEE